MLKNRRKNEGHQGIKFGPGSFGSLEETSAIKQSHSYTQRMGANGMNPMNMNGGVNSGYMNKKGMPINNNKERNMGYNGFSPKYQSPMKPNGYSPVDRQSFEHPMSPNQGYYNKPRNNINNPNYRPNRPNRQPGSPSQHNYYYNNRYQQNSYQEGMQSMSPPSRPFSPPNVSIKTGGAFSPQSRSPIMNKGSYRSPNTFNYEENVSPVTPNTISSAVEFSPIKKKSSFAIDIIDPETKEKKNFDNIKSPNPTTHKIVSSSATPATVEATTPVKAEIKPKKENTIPLSGTETPVNEVVDTTMTPISSTPVNNQNAQVVESDVTETETAVASSTSGSEVEELTTTEVMTRETTKKVEEVKEVKEETKKVPKYDVRHIPHKPIEEDEKEEVKPNVTKEAEKLYPTTTSFEEINYPENTEIPVITDNVIRYTTDFLLLFKKVCTKVPSQVVSIPSVANSSSNKNSEKAMAHKNASQNKNNNSNRSKNNKNFHGNNNNNNNSFDHNNKKNLGNRSMSNNSSRKGNMGRSYSRRQQQQQQQLDLPPVAPLQKSENAWSRSKNIDAENADEEERAEIIFRKVKGILNKLTLEKFEVLSDQIVNIGIENENILKGIIKLIFDKAIDEPSFGKIYAKLCKYINEKLPKVQEWVKIEVKNNTNKNGSKGNNVFRRLLLNRCQEEFEKNKNNKWNDDEDEKPVSQMTDEEKLEYSKKQSERTKKKRRSLGNIRFIGELYMNQLITEKVIHICFYTLFSSMEHPDEENIECLCYLLETVGEKVEKQAKLSNNNGIKFDEWNKYFKCIENISKSKELPSRMRFMLMDTLELRRKKWKSKNSEAGPKTIAEIHEEAEKELKEQEMQRKSGRSGSGRSNSSRSVDYGRGSRRSESMIIRNQNKLDKNELKSFGKIAKVDNNMTQTFLGPSGGRRFGLSKSNSTNVSRSATLPASSSPLKVQSNNIFDALNEDNNKPELVSEPQEDKPEKKIQKMDKEKALKRIKLTFEEYISLKDIKEAIESIKEIGTNEFNQDIIKTFIDVYSDSKEDKINAGADLIVKFYEEKIITNKDIMAEIKDQAEFIEDMIFDAPGIYDFYGILMAKLFIANAVNMKEIEEITELMKDVMESKRTGVPPSARFMGSVLKYIKQGQGESAFSSMCLKEKIDLKQCWYDKYDVEVMVDWIIEKKLECIWPLVDTFKTLINKIKQEPANEILNYIHSSVDGFTKDSQEFVNGLVQITLKNMIKNKEIMESYEKQNEYIKSFSTLLKSDLIQPKQEKALSSIEVVCTKNRNDKETLINVYKSMISQEILDKEILKKHINDENTKLTNEMKSKIQEILV